MLTINNSAETPNEAKTTQEEEAQSLLRRIERLPLARWHLRVRSVVGFATFIDAIDFVAIALVLPILAGKWHLTGPQIGLLISSSFLGQLFGTLVFPVFAERHGRIPVLAFTVLWFGIAGVGCALSWSYTSLMVMRFIQGIGMGPETPIAAVYISEIAPAERRGRFTLLYQLVFGIGLIAAGVLGRVLVPMFGWQSIFWIGAIPALVVAPLIYCLPESARWLISTGRIEKARCVVSRIENAIVKSGKTLPPVSDRIDVVTIRTIYPAGSAWRELFSSFYKGRTLLIWTLWIAVGFISWPLTTWLPTIYRTVYHISIEQSLTFGMVNNITIFCSLVLCAFLIDPVGRRKYFAAAFTVAACALLALVPGDRSIEKLFLFSSVCLFGISSLNVGVHVYTAELYPTRLRAVGLGICNAWSRIAGLLAPWVIGLGVQAGGLGTVFLVLGSIAACAAVLTAFFGVETRRRILEEVSP